MSDRLLPSQSLQPGQELGGVGGKPQARGPAHDQVQVPANQGTFDPGVC